MKNERIAKGFDRLSPVYVGLSRTVFGRSLQHAQEYLLPFIKSDDHLLILGGGSGDLLKSVLSLHPHLKIDYIDISKKMIQLAREKTQNPANVTFIVSTEEHIPDRTYTVVITNFYLDLFSDSTLPHLVQKIKTHLSVNAQWLVTDFVSNKGWHKIMLWIMYRFFRSVASIEARTLPNWEKYLARHGFSETNSKVFYKGFIKSARYIKV